MTPSFLFNELSASRHFSINAHQILGNWLIIHLDIKQIFLLLLTSLIFFYSIKICKDLKKPLKPFLLLLAVIKHSQALTLEALGTLYMWTYKEAFHLSHRSLSANRYNICIEHIGNGSRSKKRGAIFPLRVKCSVSRGSHSHLIHGSTSYARGKIYVKFMPHQHRFEPVFSIAAPLTNDVNTRERAHRELVKCSSLPCRHITWEHFA